AVRAGARQGQSGCVYCGLCMYGCPHELIYNSSETLASLRKNPNFTYIPNVIVRRLSETMDAVTIDSIDAHSREPRSFSGERALLACGVVSTTRLLLESMRAYDR